MLLTNTIMPSHIPFATHYIMLVPKTVPITGSRMVALLCISQNPVCFVKQRGGNIQNNNTNNNNCSMISWYLCHLHINQNHQLVALYTDILYKKVDCREFKNCGEHIIYMTLLRPEYLKYLNKYLIWYTVCSNSQIQDYNKIATP